MRPISVLLRDPSPREDKCAMEKIVIVQVRGTIGASEGVRETLKSLRLHRQNYCTVVLKAPTVEGMIQKAKDFITWGEIDEETHKMLIEKRGGEDKGVSDSSKEKGQKGYFRLNPPRKGYGRKGVKKVFGEGGALGYRGEKINDLIRRML